MSRISAGIYSPERSKEVVERLRQAADKEDRVIEIDRGVLAGDQLVSEERLESPSDVADWLASFGFDRDICEFYADSVRAGQNLVVFEAARDDEHFDRAVADMRAAEPPDVQRMLERWQAGERDVFPKDVVGIPPAEGVEEGGVPVEASEPTTSTEAAEPIRDTDAPVPPPESVEERGVPLQAATEVGSEPEGTIIEGGERRSAVPSGDMGGTGASVTPGALGATETEAGIGTEAEEEELGAEETLVDESTFRSHFEDNYGNGTASFDDYRDAYAFGYGYGRQPRLRGMEFESAEATLMERYEQRHGQGSYERVREAIRHGWDLGRR